MQGCRVLLAALLVAPAVLTQARQPAAFLAAYNEAAARHNAATGESLALWSPRLLRRLTVSGRSAGQPPGQASVMQKVPARCLDVPV